MKAKMIIKNAFAKFLHFIRQKSKDIPHRLSSKVKDKVALVLN